MPKIESKIIIGYSNLSFLISIRYLLEISKTKKDAIRINAFEYKANPSMTKLSLNTLTVSLSPLKTIKIIKKITEIHIP